MVMATHHDGLALHQVFIARCKRGPDIGSATIIRADRDFAWGCRGATEQFEAHHGGRELQVDLDRVLEDSTLCCKSLREHWRKFGVEVPLPRTPCLIVRAPTESDESPGHAGVMTHYAARNEGLAKLLDSFCGIFGIRPESDTGRRFQLAMIRLDGRSTPRPPRSVLFATNVAFSRYESSDAAHCHPITVDTVGVLQDLGSLMALARGVAKRKRDAEEMRRLARLFLRRSLSRSSEPSH